RQKMNCGGISTWMPFLMALRLSAGQMPMAATSFALRATFLWNPDEPSHQFRPPSGTCFNVAELRDHAGLNPRHVPAKTASARPLALGPFFLSPVLRKTTENQKGANPQIKGTTLSEANTRR